MKIISRGEFYKMPEGTLYSEFEPNIFSGLRIKGETIYDDGDGAFDFYYMDLIGNLMAKSSSEVDDLLREIDGKEMKLCFNAIQRDGQYKQEQLYAVYSKEDMLNFALTIMNSLQAVM